MRQSFPNFTHSKCSTANAGGAASVVTARTAGFAAKRQDRPKRRRRTRSYERQNAKACETAMGGRRAGEPPSENQVSGVMCPLFRESGHPLSRVVISRVLCLQSKFVLSTVLFLQLLLLLLMLSLVL